MSKVSQEINDAYYTPQAIINQLVQELKGIEGKVIYEPCCGDGRLTNPFKTNNIVIQSDLPNNYLDFRLGIPVDLIIMNPPFTYDKEFIELAVREAKLVYAILPLSWSRLKMQDQLDPHIHIDLLQHSDSKYFETSIGKRRVFTGIYKITYDKNRCRICYSKTYGKDALEKLGITWSNKPIEGGIPLVKTGSVAGSWIYPEKARHYYPSSVAWIKLTHNYHKIADKDLRKIAKFAATIPCLGLVDFCHIVYQLNDVLFYLDSQQKILEENGGQYPAEVVDFEMSEEMIDLSLKILMEMFPPPKPKRIPPKIVSYTRFR